MWPQKWAQEILFFSQYALDEMWKQLLSQPILESIEQCWKPAPQSDQNWSLKLAKSSGGRCMIFDHALVEYLSEIEAWQSC